jgi:hypothetical protein
MRILVVALLAFGCGCAKKTSDGVRLKQVNDAFLAAGFKLDSFHPADATKFSAERCAAGSLDGIDAMVCEYPNAVADSLGRKAGEDWVAQSVTGAVLSNGNTLLALADRAHADPHGKLIHRIAQAYQHTK